MANVLYALKNTHKISLKEYYTTHAKRKKGVKKSLLVVDMPKGSYSDKKTALKNAKLVMKLTKCDAIKLRVTTKILASLIS